MPPVEKSACFDPGASVVWTKAAARPIWHTNMPAKTRYRMENGRLPLPFCILLDLVSIDNITPTKIRLYSLRFTRTDNPPNIRCQFLKLFGGSFDLSLLFGFSC
mmetsp:Transcript_32000/g.75259  ORF Transcript_32000/g.75259 Transcript_32000/m.75259 type:complete len:104 (-) Transcript_32000:33-344(-)